ncbi:MAG: helix-turn-helix transcriptional regulator [Proteobacteria bacterium]|nr:helix-turn-helix transcriptional regulator [Pseudomonadota bacterium]
MSPSIHTLGHGVHLTLQRADVDGPVLLIGGGRGASVRIEGPVAGVWLPLRGRLQLSVGDGKSTHHRGEVRVTSADAGIRATGRGHALWLALLSAPAVWRGALGAGRMSDAGLLPALHEIDHAGMRRAFELVRAVRSGDGAAWEAILDEVDGMQARLDEMIARCPGRTWAQRRHVFLRLQRVREHLACNYHLDLDNAALARIASYSPWHFIRAFHAAYRETPHAFLVRQRLLRAQRLLHTSPLAIGEIALACGFENRCAFSRLYRQRFGTTASASRRSAFAAPMPRAIGD